MSLSEQVQRVDGGQNAALKKLIEKLGGTVPGTTKIDGYAAIAAALTVYTADQQLSSTTKTAYELGSDATPDDVLAYIAPVLSTLQGTLSGKGNGAVYFGNYTGTGTHDEGGARTLTFPYRPLVVFIGETFDSSSMVATNGSPTVYTRASGAAWNRASWGDKTFTWWSDNAGAQLNESGKKYNVVCLMGVDL